MQNDHVSLSALGIRSGEALIVEEAPLVTNGDAPTPTPDGDGDADDGVHSLPSPRSYGDSIPPQPQQAPSDTTISASASEGHIVRRVIPSDNSCLFNSVAYCLDGHQARSKSHRYAPGLRKVIADIIAANPLLYDEAFLGKSNSEYADWIRKNESWGGAIELSLLSQFYRIQIRAFDIQTTRTDCFGEGQNYSCQIFLLYDGIHYDLLAINPLENGPEEFDQTVFSTGDEAAVEKALRFVQKLNKEKQFTDLSGFTLRCLVCKQGLKGQKEAAMHAKSTGHVNFGEYKAE